MGEIGGQGEPEGGVPGDGGVHCARSAAGGEFGHKYDDQPKVIECVLL